MAFSTRLILSIIPLLFSILAFIFSVLTVTSADWAFQRKYDDSVSDTLWTNANLEYTLYRSPFQVCTASNTTVPGTVNNVTGDHGPPASVTYQVHCKRYRPYGHGKTSCELPIYDPDDTAGNQGDARQCQQVHYAGNLAITGLVFTSLGMLLVMSEFVVAVLSTGPAVDQTSNWNSNPKKNDEAAPSADVNKTDTQTQTAPLPPSSAQSRQRQLRLIGSYTNLVLLIFFFIAVATTILSQYYGVLAFIQSSVNNADFATQTGNHEHHDPWIQGRALSIYATLVWVFSLVVMLAAAKAWRLPSFPQPF